VVGAQSHLSILRLEKISSPAIGGAPAIINIIPGRDQ